MSEKFTVMRLFGDHMILQSGQENCVRGKAPSGEKITLAISGGRGDETVLNAVSNENREYEISMPPYPP